MTGTRSRKPGGNKPPASADWLLKHVLPAGKRGESIRGDLLEEFRALPGADSRLPTRSLWFWAQTLRLTARYAFSNSPQQSLTYPGRYPMWLDLHGDLRTAFRMLPLARMSCM